ncbi:hypothetical protein TCON_1262 [Astathelohania contejeani]|uniref:Activator of Hsp90 ATPase N-terminal domain-containing protein n=1 Tax=Astathelohania contejeani TaxID=164912 RepID=A0ABQ7HZE1_9MICR|nr:hypothetical protein TCON_1262 [Thelohania contejeani]
MHSRNPNNYHWVESDISAWSMEFIKSRLSSHGLTPKAVEGSVHLAQRMNRIGVVYHLTMDVIDQQGHNTKTMDFDEYSSLDDIEGPSNKILYGIIEEMKEEAKKELSKQVLESTDSTKNVTSSNQNKELVFKISCEKSEFTTFLLEDKFIRVWTLNEYTRNSTEINIRNKILMSDIKQGEDTINMNWKPIDWSNYIPTIIHLNSDNNGTLVRITHKNIKINQIDMIKDTWIEYYFKPISQAFGFTFRIE